MPRQGYASIYPGTEADDERAQQGWNSYVRGGDDAMSFDREQRIRAHEDLATRLEQSRLQRELAHDEELAKRKLRLDALAPTALRDLNAINPNDENALQKMLEHGSTHAELYDGELGDKRMAALYDARMKMIQGATAKRDQLAASKAAQEAAIQARQDIANEAAQTRKDLLKQHQDERATDAAAQAASDALVKKKAEEAGLLPSEATIDGMKYTNPKAAKSEEDKVLARQKQERILTEEAMASSHPEYGYVDATGNFKTTQSGAAESAGPGITGQPQPHVRISYQTPAGAVKTEVMQRPLFEQMVTNAAARKASSAKPVADTAAAGTPPAVTEVQASIPPEIPPAQPDAVSPVAGATPDAGAIPPDITPEAHAALKPGDKFWWKGKQLTKQ